MNYTAKEEAAGKARADVSYKPDTSSTIARSIVYCKLGRDVNHCCQGSAEVRPGTMLRIFFVYERLPLSKIAMMPW